MTENAPSPDQKLALVTGASRGLGAALAEALGARGWHVIAVARTAGGLEELDDRIRAAGGSATLAPLDVTDPGAMTHLGRSLRERWGGLDLWAHTAIHAAALTPAGHVDQKDWTRSLATNVTAVAQLIAVVEPLLRARRGTALFPDDPRGGQPFFGTYGASKAAQIALVRSWQAEGAKLGPRVAIETPPAMPTALRARFFPGEDRMALIHPREVARGMLAAVLGG
ncbi:SDR family NAD(P)-dependent oxidoreductase [Paracoccus sp. S-4012]|uniref:SDR family NAD(P)-dependent oxidoreductase n=1 Tax=Paracoccus sp. S-4012 TaxID=2665648 RepID=UPI0012B0BEDF|nr:SDR family oxidoreductase [Paracoccus sp. S-4012]MRX51608.1 SDR family NAD(P)-dependent oxidoreductase [Paracoccus sp. S-4012]